MKSITKFRILTLLVVIAMVIGITNISNAYSVTGSLSSSDKLVAGGTASVTFSLGSIDAEDGVRSITIDKVNYDTNVFEAITSSSFTASNGWKVSYSASSGAMTLTNDTPVNSASSVVTLALKIKSGITATSASVSFQGIVASSGLTTGDIAIGTKTATLKTDAAAEESSTPATPAKSTTPAASSTTTTSKQTTAAKSGVSTLPKTGVGMGIVISAAVVVIAGAIFYGLYRNLKKYNI